MTPQLDVSSLFSDPDFVGPIVHIARTEAQNSYGENILTECPTPAVGSVQPAEGALIQRLPEAERIANMMSFWIKGQITFSGPGKYPDILVFQGKRFQVKTVFDWSSWGAGYSEGLCVAERPS